VGVVTSTLNRDVLRNNPSIDYLFCYDKGRPFGHLGLVKSIRAMKFDLVIVLHTVSFSLTSVMLALLSGAAVRAGSTSRPFGHGLSEVVFHVELPLPSPEELASMNETEHNLFPLAPLGVHTADLSPLLVSSESEHAWADEFLRQAMSPERIFLAVHPGAGKRENVWAPERFASVINSIGEMKPLTAVVIEGPRDAAYVESFRRNCRVPFLVVRRRTIGEVGAVLRASAAVLCNDTGVMHVACAAGATTVAVFGPTEPGRWTPKCDNLHIVRAPGGDLERLSPKEVVSAVARVLQLELGTQSDA
jgi:ADP-heptose:LPS heptosyltransferase